MRLWLVNVRDALAAVTVADNMTGGGDGGPSSLLLLVVVARRVIGVDLAIRVVVAVIGQKSAKARFCNFVTNFWHYCLFTEFTTDKSNKNRTVIVPTVAGKLDVIVY